MQKSYIRKGTYDIYQILNIVKPYLNINNEKKNDIIELDGDLIHANSQRYQTFLFKGCMCCKCGLKAKYFAKEKDINAARYHLNLYGIDDNGEEVLFTKDHIIPKSKGGKNNISNYQTMCYRCNEEKGNKTIKIKGE